MTDQRAMGPSVIASGNQQGCLARAVLIGIIPSESEYRQELVIG